MTHRSRSEPPDQAFEAMLRRIQFARRMLGLAWATWEGCRVPRSVVLAARVNHGQLLLEAEPPETDEARERWNDLLAMLKRQLEEERRKESAPGPARDGLERWQDSEARFDAALAEYMALVRSAWQAGVYVLSGIGYEGIAEHETEGV